MKTLTSITEGGTLAPDEGELPPAPASQPRPADLDGEYTYLLGCPKPIIAAINGACAGMAVPIALSCDLRFMADDAVMLTAFAQRGLIAEWGLSWLLPRVVGSARAMDLLISSRKVTRHRGGRDGSGQQGAARRPGARPRPGLRARHGRALLARRRSRS